MDQHNPTAAGDEDTDDDDHHQVAAGDRRDDNDQIRARLDKLNALSDLINSLERQSDDANSLFASTLKCSTDRLSSLAKALGSKCIRHGRSYHAAKLSVEQSQLDCQRACVQFEQANNAHHLAKQALTQAEIQSEELSSALKLAEQQRCQSKKLHQDRANKLMRAQESLLQLERDHGPSIRRTQLYFEEAKKFNAKLGSVKSEICRIGADIMAAKQAYALTLRELEQFSEELHEASLLKPPAQDVD